MPTAKPTLSATSATQYFINIDYPAVNILRKKGGQEKLVPVIIQPITNPRQLLLDNIDHISIETLLDIMLPDGKKVDISEPLISIDIYYKQNGIVTLQKIFQQKQV